MTQGRVEVITSVERRQRWSAAEKRQLVAASLEPGASVSAIARDGGDSSPYGWRRQLRAQPQLGFAPARIAPEAPTCVSSPGTIEIEFAGGARMRITGAADAATLMAVVGALANGRRRRSRSPRGCGCGLRPALRLPGF
jgi:transposase